uniref:Uncharacterized protein n=1 Tax=Anguilla anguilla TaxID=7936 RepID=A0A0E9VTI9_ANGAN
MKPSSLKKTAFCPLGSDQTGMGPAS